MSSETSLLQAETTDLVKTAPVIGVGLDDLTTGRIAAALRESGVVFLSTTLEASLKMAGDPKGPAVFLVPWVESKAETIERYSRSLHAAYAVHGCRVVAIAESSLTADLQALLGTSIDDVLLRPFGQDLATRLHVASLVARQVRARSPQEVLADVIERGGEGEIVIRSGDISAGIHVQGSHVVWAHLSDEPASLEEIFGEMGAPLDPDVLRDVHAECAREKRHFVEVMVSWNLLDEPVAREAARAFVAGRVERILALPAAVAMWLPRPARRPERIRFKVSEIASPRAMPRARLSEISGLDGDSPPSQSHSVGRLTQITNAVLAIGGASGVAVLDRRTGNVLLEVGAALDTAAAWSHLASLSVYGSYGEEVMVTARGQCTLLRPLDASCDNVVLATFRLDAISHGLARVSLARVIDHVTRALSPNTPLRSLSKPQARGVRVGVSDFLVPS